MQLMPSGRINSLEDVKEALLVYQRASKMRITLEIVLMDGVNDTQEDIRRLIDFIPPLQVVVNIIPWNPVPGIQFRTPAAARVSGFSQALMRRGIKVTRRYRRGVQVHAACGQLGE